LDRLQQQRQARRQYEPFFTDTHRFEFDVKIGVSPVLFYDPVERVVRRFVLIIPMTRLFSTPWQQTSYDVNDTVTFNPKADEDIKEFFTRLQDADYLPTWYDQRLGGFSAPRSRTLRTRQLSMQTRLQLRMPTR